MGPKPGQKSVLITGYDIPYRHARLLLTQGVTGAHPAASDMHLPSNSTPKVVHPFFFFLSNFEPS